jgi:GNAT superfamily N-acetyltransferase
MQFRVAAEQDVPGIVRLSGEMFSDGEALVRRSIDMWAGPGQVYVALDAEERVVAQLFAVPCCVAECPGVYLYALATVPGLRKGGVMSALMQYAEEAEANKGAHFAVLIPADEPLYGYYEKRGYTKKVLLRRVEKELLPRQAKDVDFTPFAPQVFAALRARYIKMPYVDFTPDRYGEVLADVFESGGLCVQSGEGYALCFERRNSLVVAELFAKSDVAADRLLTGAALKLGGAKTALTLAQNSNLYEGQGVLQPAALWKPLWDKFDVQALYLRFGFDEIKE